MEQHTPKELSFSSPHGGESGPYECCSCCPVPMNKAHRCVIGCFFTCTVCCYPLLGRNNASRGGVLFAMAGLSVTLLAFGGYFIEGSVEAQSLDIPFPVPADYNGTFIWSFGAAVYWSIITSSTIGYGDITPKTTGGKLWTMFIGTLAIFCLTAMLAHFSGKIVEFMKKEQVTARCLKRWHNTKSYALFLKMRISILITSLYIALILIGGGLFGYGEPFPEPQYMNGIYFSWVTIATVGYGDLLCKQAWTRFFVCIYAMIGIALYSYLIGVLAKNTGIRMVSKADRSWNAVESSLDTLERRIIFLGTKQREELFQRLDSWRLQQEKEGNPVQIGMLEI